MKLKDICIDMHQGINTVADKVEYIDSGIPILQSKNITCGYIDLHDVRFLSEKDYEKYQEKYQPKINDLLVSNIGTIGKTVIVNKKEKFLIAWNIFMIKTNPNLINSKFLKYYFDYLDNINYYNQFLTGGTVKFVNKKNMENILIPDLSLDEQICISTKLDKIYKMIELRKNEIEKCNNLIKSQFVEMFGNPNINEYNFEKSTLGEKMIFHQGTQFSIDDQSLVKKDGYVRFLRIIDFTQPPQIPRYVENKGYYITPDTVVMVRYGATAGFISSGYEGILANNLFSIIPKNKEKYHYKFLEEFLKTEYIHKQIIGGSTSSTMPAISHVAMKKVEILEPPIELQTKFAQIVEQIDKQKFEFEKSLKKLEALQASLMQEYFG